MFIEPYIGGRRSGAIRNAQTASALLQSNILESEIQTAARVAKLIVDSGFAGVERPADMVAFIRQHVYKPENTSVTVPAFKAA